MKAKEKMKENKGITLIGLVVTIIVLLILAGISILMLAGNNGILTKTAEAKEETRAGAVEEAKRLWEMNKTADEDTNGSTAESLDELLDRLVSTKLLNEGEKEKVLENGEVTIGKRTIEFGTGVKINISVTPTGGASNLRIVRVDSVTGLSTLTEDKMVNNMSIEEEFYSYVLTAGVNHYCQMALAFKGRNSWSGFPVYRFFFIRI